jgi:superfamily II DNA or RNA helicase
MVRQAVCVPGPCATGPSWSFTEDWEGCFGVAAGVLYQLGVSTARCLDSYRVNPYLVAEHFGIEQSVAESGYDRRQIFELVQNGADAILEQAADRAPGETPGGSGRIAIVLTHTHLYCANEGAAIDGDGVKAILGAFRSKKRGNEIGRFGVGFKSVLGVCSAPEFHSTSGSFRFDRAESERQILEVAPEEHKFPVLRLAFPVDSNAAARDDSVLAELLSWATTVVRLPLDDTCEWLEEQLREFPEEFLLFSSHVTHLVLDNKRAGERRSIEVKAETAQQVNLSVDDISSTWKVFATEVELDEELKRRAAELQDRDTLPLSWAVPTERSASRGRFWAFFPMENDTTLRGILNAPWRTNSDRQIVLEGEFNQFLINKAVGLVLSNLHALQAPDDPARHLDFLPARGREASTWADRHLTGELWEQSQDFEILPDQNGQLRLPEEIRIPPDGISVEALDLWAEAADRPLDWLHAAACSTRDRRARVDYIRAAASVDEQPPDEWLSAIAAPDVSASSAAIRVAAQLRTDGTFAESAWLGVPIVLTTSGDLVTADPRHVAIGSDHVVSAGVRYALVDPGLLESKGVPEALEILGIRPLSTEVEAESILAGRLDLDSAGWENIWNLLGQMPAAAAVSMIEHADATHKLQARALDGSWVRITSLLIPGPIVPADGSRDAGVALDAEFHRDTLDVLEEIGLGRAPVYRSDNPSGPLWAEYLQEQRERFLRSPLVRGRRIDRHLVTPTPMGWVGALEPLPRLSEQGKERFTAAVLDESARLSPWVFSHTNPDYGTLTAPNPSTWTMRKYGAIIPTSLGPTPVEDSVHPSLQLLSDLLPVAEVTHDIAGQLGLPAEIAALPERVRESALVTATGDPQLLGKWLCALSRSAVDLPASIPYEGSPVSLANVVVATESDGLADLAASGRPVALVEHVDDLELLLGAGLARAAVEVAVEIEPFEPADAGSVQSRFPDLALDPAFDGIDIVLCEGVTENSHTSGGSRRRPVDTGVAGRTVYVTEAGNTDENVLKHAQRIAGRDLDSDEMERLKKSAARDSGRHLEADIRGLATTEEKLLAAIGVDQLRWHLPTGLLDSLESRTPLPDEEIARLALSVHDIEILRVHQNALQANGLQPPSSFGGSVAAVRFVEKLGFPSEFAGFRSERRRPYFVSEGSPELPKLHPFQEAAERRIRATLKKRKKKEESDNRGLLSLPTGAGKTRVTIEALIGALVDGDIEGPVLWIAQTDELCEQAVQAWDQAWRAIGPAEGLRISRLWSINEVPEPDSHLHVVVATIAKIDASVRGTTGYEWLSRAGAVIIDEAHRAISPEYTRALDWLGLGRNKRRCPLIGLTATPFRGTSESETVRLVKRFGARRLDDFEDGDPYEKLQADGVLALVDHRLLRGVDVVLSDEELDYLQRTRRLPRGVEARIGEDKTRNEEILAAIHQLPDKSTALLFATSVDHAETMAGLLSYEGIPARAISSSTPRAVRRHLVEEFRAGRIRVLTNYGVLTEGFDAPAVEAVVVARPTYSPNVYQQMVGRGLRGPKNGGKERCLIINVEDNLARFGEQLAFRGFEGLWTRN